MNIFEIITQLSEVDSDVLGRFDSRRAVFSSLGTVAKRTALATSPLFVGALFQKAYAGTKSLPEDILQYALTLELLEQNFYAKVQSSSFYSAASLADRAAIDQIKKHEDAHVVLLRAALTALNATPVTRVTFKQSTFDSLTSFNGPAATSILGVAQLLEDTGVRAYKGRAAELRGTALLTTALQIHSVEARHAAHIRLMRGQKPWLNTADDLAANPVYRNGVTTATTSTTTPLGYGIPAFDPTKPSALESNVTQSAVDLTATTFASPAYTAAAAAAAFDEALQPAEVLDNSRAGSLVGA